MKVKLDIIYTYICIHGRRKRIYPRGRTIGLEDGV